MSNQANSQWYDKGQLLSHNKFFNMIIGSRGVGKSYGFKTWGIRDFIDRGKQFVWVRRYKTEIDTMKEFFADIKQEFVGKELKVVGGKKYGSFLVDGKVAGFYITLSTSSALKGTPFPQVDKIIFDEFLIDKSTYRYLKNEVVVLLDLVETVFRLRDERGVFLIANAITFANPYFLYFKVPVFKQRFYRQEHLLVENYTNQVYLESKRQTRFGQLIDGTEYGNYSMENKPLLDSDVFIERKSDNARFKCGIKYNGAIYGFWLDYHTGVMYANKNVDPSSYAIYSLTRDDHDLNTLLIGTYRNTRINDIVICFRTASLRFETTQVKAQVYELLSYFVR